MVDDVVEQLGHLALGTRLKRIGERLQGETTRFIAADGLAYVKATHGFFLECREARSKACRLQ